MFAGPNTQWVENGNHYRCPRCATLYQPWVAKSGLIPAQKIMILEAPETVETAVGDFKKGEIIYFLFEWPDSATQKMANKFKEIAIGIQKEFTEKSPEEVLKDVKTLVDRVAHRSYFTQLDFKAKSEIDYINQQGKNITKPWKYDHLLHGVTGLHYKYRLGDAILSHAEFIRVWGIVIYMMNQAKMFKLKEGK